MAELLLEEADGEGADVKVSTTSQIWREILCQVGHFSQVGLGQIRLVQVRSGQVRSGQVRSR